MGFTSIAVKGKDSVCLVTQRKVPVRSACLGGCQARMLPPLQMQGPPGCIDVLDNQRARASETAACAQDKLLDPTSMTHMYKVRAPTRSVTMPACLLCLLPGAA